MSLKLWVMKPAQFNWCISWREMAIILSWVASTEVKNLLWLKLMTIKWRWPPVKSVTCFTDAETYLTTVV